MANKILDSLPGKPSMNKWEQVKQEIISRIESGAYAFGEKIPSENAIAVKGRLARSTVRHAYDELEREGYIGRIRGKGTFVSFPKKEHQLNDTLGIFSLIIPEIKRDLYPSLMDGFDAGANSEHKQMMICPTNYDVNKQGNIILQLIDKKVSGVAIVPTLQYHTPDHHIRLLQNNKIPVVFCHRGIPGIKAPVVAWDNKKVGRIAAEAFLEKGHRNMAYFALCRYSLTESYEKGFREVLAANGVCLSEKNVWYGSDEEINDGQKRDDTIRRFLAKEKCPTAIFCNDDTMAERVYWVSLELGLKVPEDLAIIGFGSSEREGVVRSKLTSVVIDEYALGYNAADMLSEIQAGQRSIDSDDLVLMPLKLVSGKTI